MNYLQLSQRAVRESGTISGDNVPSTVVGQTGRLRKFVDWTPTAWDNIQSANDDWLWMQAEFSGSLTANVSTYTPASFSLTRHRKWITTLGQMSLYLTATGVSDETPLCFVEYLDFRRIYGQGSQTAARPTEYTVTPANSLIFGALPDDAYTVRGLYQKSNQTLAANTDTPEMPAEFHMLIVWETLLLIAEFDKSGITMQAAQRKRQDLWRHLNNMQRPNPYQTGGLA